MGAGSSAGTQNAAAPPPLASDFPCGISGSWGPAVNPACLFISPLYRCCAGFGSSCHVPDLSTCSRCWTSQTVAASCRTKRENKNKNGILAVPGVVEATSAAIRDKKGTQNLPCPRPQHLQPMLDQPDCCRILQKQTYYEIWKCYQSTRKVHGQVLQNLIVPHEQMKITSVCRSLPGIRFEHLQPMLGQQDGFASCTTT